MPVTACRESGRDAPKLLVIGAHPDDAEYHAGGLAAVCARAGWDITLVYVTDGAAGHFRGSPATLRRRRSAEARAAAAVIGARSIGMGFGDGELYVTPESTRAMCRVIRREKPDIIVTHRLGDYHRDHDRTARLVLDCAYLLRAPLFCPRVAALDRMPVILYFADRFTENGAFDPHWAIEIKSVIKLKAAMLARHRSQFAEWLPWIGGGADALPYAGYAADYATLEDGMCDAVSELGRRAARAFGRAFAKLRCPEFFQVSEYGDWQAGNRLRERLPMLVRARGGAKL